MAVSHVDISSLSTATGGVVQSAEGKLARGGGARGTRLLPASATYTFPAPSTVVLSGWLRPLNESANCP
jgi:hypothetical protein